VQFDYPSHWERTVEAVLPEEWTAKELPPSLSVDHEIGRFESRVTMDGNRLHFGWLESIESTFIPVDKYSLVRDWDQAGFDSDRKGVLFSTR
jgi:hypothetical protein